MNPILSLIVANIIWGAASPIFKFSLTNIPPFTLAFIRFFFGSLIFIPFILKYDFRKIKKEDWVLIFLGSISGIFINIAFFFLGIMKTESINAPVIASGGPIILFILSIVFLHEKPNLKVFGGMLISLLGIIVIIFSPLIFDGRKAGEISMLQGNIFLILATLGSVGAPIFLKSVLKTISPFVISFLTFIISAFGFFPLMLGELRSWSFGELNMAGWTGILFGVFLCSALAYFLFYDGMSKIEAQQVGLFTYVDPIAAVIIAAPLLHEYPNLYFILGSVLVFGGIYLAEGRLHWHPIGKLRIKN